MVTERPKESNRQSANGDGEKRTADPASLEKLTVEQLKALLREKKLPVSGRKNELVQRLKNGPNEAADPASLEKLTVEQLKALLRKKKLPVSGRKNELVQRLKNGPNEGGSKPKAWQHSDANKDLKRAVLDPTSSIHNMSLESVRRSDDRFGQYPNFAKYFAKLKLQVQEEKLRVHHDNIAVQKYRQCNPRSYLNKRGYPHWDTHPAKKC